MRYSTAFLCAAMLFAPRVPAQTATQGKGKGSVERIKVHGKSLEGNLEGDSPDREVSIYLPPSYKTNPNRRYPVVTQRDNADLGLFCSSAEDKWILPDPGNRLRDFLRDSCREL